MRLIVGLTASLSMGNAYKAVVAPGTLTVWHIVQKRTESVKRSADDFGLEMVAVYV